LTLKDSDATRKLWNHGFTLDLIITLRESTLTTELSVANSGADSFDFTSALHTYFAINDIGQTAIRHLKGLDYQDKVTSTRKHEDKVDVLFTSETDRAYFNAPNKIEIVSTVDNTTHFIIEKSEFKDAVVWNPWETKQKAMADLHDWKVRWSC